MKHSRPLATLIGFVLVLSACGSDDRATESSEEASETSVADSPATGEGEDDVDSSEDEEAGADGGEDSATETDDARSDVTLTLITHDSFLVSDGTIEAFTAETGISVNVLSAGDAGEIVSRAVFTAGDPEGDVLFGIDNTFLQRGLDADVFEPYESTELGSVPAELQLDDQRRVTPIDFGDVCVNYWTDALPGDAPMSLDDLRLPENAATFVTQHPETSSPGFAFLLATIARYGDDWEGFWQDLADGGVTVAAGWSEAYYEEFSAGGGDNAIVTSYASSPVAEVIFADPAVDAPPTGVLVDSCFRQIEFAGILAGTEHPVEAGMLIDFMLAETFQSDIPLNMFVSPANSLVALPDAFVEHGTIVDEPLSLDPAEIEANRAEWTERWSEIVLG